MTDKISSKLLSRYSKRVPRYTSYPPTTLFHDVVPTEVNLAFLRASRNHEKPLSLYVHLPFCEKMCNTAKYAPLRFTILS